MVQFQILDISSDDIEIDNKKYFIITLYGKSNIPNEKDDRFNKNIVCHIKGFRPYFYLKYPNNWPKKFVMDTFIRERYLNIEKYIYKSSKNEIFNKYNEFYGYHLDDNNEEKKFKFIKLEFNSHEDMNITSRMIKKYCEKYYNGVNISNDKMRKDIEDFINICKENDEYRFDSNLYESNIHPILRFLHEKNIKPCGWVELNDNKIKEKDDEKRRFNVDIEYEYLNKKYIKGIDINEINKLIIASFDIECDSSHGDFPNPIKDFRKLCIDIVDYYKLNSLNTISDDNIIINKIKKIIEVSNEGDEYINKLYLENGPISQKSIDNTFIKKGNEICNLLKESLNNSKSRELCVKELNNIFCKLKNNSNEKIIVKGDPIIQIGTVFHKYGDEEVYDRSIVVMGNKEEMEIEDICSDIENVNVYRCKTERELLLKWKDLILKHNPDYITGYNIFNFDFDYIIKRVSVLFECDSRCRFDHFRKCMKHHHSCDSHEFYKLGRLMKDNNNDYFKNIDLDDKTVITNIKNGGYWLYKDKWCKTVYKRLGGFKNDKEEDNDNDFAQNTLKYIHMDGRIIFDVQTEVKKGTSLDSYKLDNVGAHFMRGKIKTKENYIDHFNHCWLTTDDTGKLKVGDYISISILTKYGEVKYNNGEKFIIEFVNKKNIKIRGTLLPYKAIYGDNFIKAEWCLCKDDVTPQELFRLHKCGGPDGRAKIAKYCIMDCELCIHLLLLLDFIPNNMGMSNVCYVPQSYIFLRGQGIKVQSLVTKFCSENGIRIPTLKQFNEEECDNSGFEGAVVLEPKTGMYLDDPIAVLDYASLYPTSINEKNLSHDTYFGEFKDVESELIKLNWKEKIDYNRIKYLDYKYETKEGTSTIEKNPVMITDEDGNEKHQEVDCVYLTDKRKRGIIPIVVSELLSARKRTKKLLKEETNENKRKVLDGVQLAYKLVANSTYGQLGAKTSSISFKKIAACTTAIGRERIDDASRLVKKYALENKMFEPEVIYGDTDSIFVKFSRNVKGKILKEKEALAYCIKCGQEAGKYITKHLHIEDKAPQDLEYEKTFWPFILISKKRYTGEKYEFSTDFNDSKRTSMGIVTKRRDNAPIVKYVFGNLINKLMYDRDLSKTKKWLEKTLRKIVNGKEDISMFILSKTLNSYYKNPESIAHKVLADRIGRRDPGNKPKANDRIPYAYIEVDDKPIYIGKKMITKRVESGKFKMINKRVDTGKRKMITKKINNGSYKNGKPKTKNVRVPEGEPIFKNIRVPEGEPIYKNISVPEGESKYKKKHVLQGDRIEHPDYIHLNNLKLDYKYYISNQIMNPVKQVLDITMNPDESRELFNKFLKNDIPNQLDILD